MPARCPPISVSLRQPLSPETLWEPGLGRRELLAWRGSLEHWQTPTLPPFLNLPWGGGGVSRLPSPDPTRLQGADLHVSCTQALKVPCLPLTALFSSPFLCQVEPQQYDG